MTREPIRTADQAIAFLMDLVRGDPRPYQARASLAQLPARALLARVGDPQIDLPAAHIAGSKGKGSTALYLEAILQAAGLRTGTFTSPHLQRWTERLRIDGREATDAEFAALFARLQPHVLALRAEDDASAPSFFDVLTAAALLLFSERRVDCAIIEAGIGGRLDATNVVQPVLTCITSVELEHTDKLGDSIAAIAGEKAGIIKRGVPVIVGTLPPEAETVIRRRATDLQSELEVVGESIDGSVLPAAADNCNARNANLAVACARRIAGDRGEFSKAVDRALAHTRPPGRMELIAEHPWIVIDGAHTPSSAAALAEMLKSVPANRIHLLASVTIAKHAPTILAPLLERADSVVITNADATRSMDGDAVAASLVAHGYNPARIRAIADPREAVLQSRGALADDDLLCVAGSMYMAGVARETLLGAGA
jgi:dihydrofolate synthase/folylpolyglutamate synthase